MTCCSLALILAMGCAPESDVVTLQAFGDPAELDAYRAQIEAFGKLAPDVRVELIPVGKQKDHMAKLTTAFAGGEPPDLFLINFRRYGQFASRGVLEPVGPRLVERGRLKESDFYDPPLEAFRVNGELVCWPQNVSSLVVYYNVAAFRDAGVAPPAADWSWNDFTAAARALTRDTDGDGSVDVWGLGFEPTLVRLAPFVWQAGGDLVDDLAAPWRFTLDSPEALEALAFVRSWSASGIVPPRAQMKVEDLETRFARGGLGMILQSRRYTATLRGVAGLDWDVAPLPRHRAAATVLHADAYCMAKSSPRKEAAYRFLEFALSTEGATIVARSGRTVPAVKSVCESPAFLDPSAPPASARVFVDSIGEMRRTPNVAAWNEVETRVDPLIEEWYFAAAEPARRLGYELNEAVAGVLRPRRP
jgi:multiple sugar transport system substrate-binding protein